MSSTTTSPSTTPSTLPIHPRSNSTEHHQTNTHRFAHSNFVNVETFTTYRAPVHSTPFKRAEWVDLSMTRAIPDLHASTEEARTVEAMDKGATGR